MLCLDLRFFFCQPGLERPIAARVHFTAMVKINRYDVFFWTYGCTSTKYERCVEIDV